MADDKKTIGMTPANKTYVGELVSAGTFGSELDAARFALAIALSNGETKSSVSGVDTTWNQGSFDPTGDTAKLITIMIPDCETPYRMMEVLLNRGFEIMRKKGSADELDIRDFLIISGDSDSDEHVTSGETQNPSE